MGNSTGALLARVNNDSICGTENGILSELRAGDRASIDAHAEVVELRRGDSLFSPGEAVQWAYFPDVGTVLSLCLLLGDGRIVEAAAVGCEGVVGGVVSCGSQPAFGTAMVQIAGRATRVPVRVVEDLKDRSPSFRRLLDRYADFLLSQVLQSVACNAFHSLEGRLCSWILTTRDRVGGSEIRLTQEALAQALGVQRTTVSTIAKELQERNLLRCRRGVIEILDRSGLEESACECHAAIEQQRAATLSSGPRRAQPR